MSNFSCTPCSDGCLTCSGTSTNCLSCTNFSGTPYYKLTNVNTCDDECPPGQFISLVFSHQCQLCSDNCVTCVGRADNCTTDGGCRNGMFFDLNQYQCLYICPNNYYGKVVDATNTSKNICEKCADECALCYGAGKTKCTKCTTFGGTPYFKYPFTDVCESVCPKGFYGEVQSLSCLPCQEACAACYGTPTNCS